MRHYPNELFAELTYATIQREAMWMEYDEEMEDFSLMQFMDEELLQQAQAFLCGYFPALNMEMAIVALPDDGKGYFYSVIRDGQSKAQVEEFVLSDRKDDFVVDMLMYAATTQIMLRENEKAYRSVVAELSQSKSGCAGCSGCGPKN